MLVNMVLVEIVHKKTDQSRDKTLLSRYTVQNAGVKQAQIMIRNVFYKQ